MQITTIGFDIAKNVFQIHGIDAAEKVVIRKQLRRGQVLKFFAALPPCLVGMEACATAHYWARELTKLGHETDSPAHKVMRVKSAEQQAQLMQHRARDLLIRQRTQVINALRAHLAELGITAAQGRDGIRDLLAIIADDGDARLPIDARASLMVLAAQLQALQTLIGSIEKRIVARHRSSEASKRLQTIPGVGILGASAIATIVTEPKAFRSGRDFAAWVGLVPSFHRWQTQARADLQAGRSLLATHLSGRCACGLEACPPASAKISVAHTAAGTASVQGRRHRAGQ